MAPKLPVQATHFACHGSGRVPVSVVELEPDEPWDAVGGQWSSWLTPSATRVAVVEERWPDKRVRVFDASTGREIYRSDSVWQHRLDVCPIS